MEAAEAANAQRRWTSFYEKLRMDMIEAQCALESGRLMRASELIDGVLHEARRTGAALGVPQEKRRLRRR